MHYQIQDRDSLKILATELTDAMLADWWKLNEKQYFGLRLEENTIMVADTTGWEA